MANPFDRFDGTAKPVAAMQLKPIIGAQPAPTSPIEEARFGLAASAEGRAQASASWRTMTPKEVQAQGLPPGVYQINGGGEVKAINTGAANKPSQEQTAGNMLKALGIDPSAKDDPIEKLILGSTSGALESGFASAYGAVTGEATPGMQNIARLKTIGADLVLAANNGSLGAGVSNSDVEFMKERFGTIGNPEVPANARAAAWREVKGRLGRLAGASAPSADGVSVSLPNGAVARFPNKVAADAFKRKAGLP